MFLSRIPSFLARPTGECVTRFVANTVYTKSSQLFHKAHPPGRTISTEKNLKEHALKLIFGDRRYEDMTSWERKTVDEYQEWVSSQEGLILPNTKLDLEQREIDLYLEERRRRKA